MRIVSWNVNGLRALIKKNVFPDFLQQSGSDIVALQETRALESQIPQESRTPLGWFSYFSSATRLGYAGVALYSRTPAHEVIRNLPDEKFNNDGRFLLCRFNDIWVTSIYFPNGSGKNRDNSRVPYKLDFYRSTKSMLDQLNTNEKVFVAGDFNTAHTRIDLARPDSNAKTSGFLPSERAELDNWIYHDWIDLFRRQHPGETGHYTWWRQWGGSRANNVGWRIDYILASPRAAHITTEAFIWPRVLGSDHCPIGVDFDLS